MLWRNPHRQVRFWAQGLRAPDFLVRAIKFGVYEKPVNAGKLTTRFVLPEIPVEPQDLAGLRSELSDATHRQIYEEISALEAHRLNRQGFPISNGFIVRTEKRRLVVNLKRQSGLFRSVPVKMETLESFALEIKPNDHLLSFDIEKGYHHFRLHPDIRNWFLFRIDGRYFRCIALPFGWKLSPFYFIKLMRPFVEYVRNRLNLRIHPYMDDFLVAVSSPTELKRAQRTLDGLLRKTGLRRKPGKGCWEGSQRLDHLGFVIDTRAQVFGITDKRVQKIQNVARKLLQQARQNRRLVETSLLRHFLGVAISCSLAMPLARFYTRSLYDSLQTQSKRRVKLKHAAVRDLLHWKNLVRSPSTRPLHHQTATMAMHSDASTSIGMGGTLGHDLRMGEPGVWEAKGLWDPHLRTKPITFLELRAVTDNLRAFAEDLRTGTHLRVWEDNQAVVHILNTMTTRSPALMKELRALHRVMLKLGISIESRYVPSAVNRFADRLSRLRSLDDWRINTRSIRALLCEMEPTIDRFADHESTICPQFNSQYRSPGSSGIDSFQQHWGQTVNFWNPPLKLIPLVVEKIVQESATGLLVTPWWPAQSWCRRLKEIGTAQLFHAPDVYLPPLWAPKHMPAPPWKIAVWTIRNNSH